ncbi:unnamed protein product [Enterobius vermicularis]|uniref:EGF-like domain-containing protein n=1 Tax=Enterobius vermicularis TaxID=51028 RepID=A0A0N4VCK2_ENTVE|nr:unnamed protein product [Enterobius vermicularis]
MINFTLNETYEGCFPESWLSKCPAAVSFPPQIETSTTVISTQTTNSPTSTVQLDTDLSTSEQSTTQPTSILKILKPTEKKTTTFEEVTELPVATTLSNEPKKTTGKLFLTGSFYANLLYSKERAAITSPERSETAIPSYSYKSEFPAELSASVIFLKKATISRLQDAAPLSSETNAFKQASEPASSSYSRTSSDISISSHRVQPLESTTSPFKETFTIPTVFSSRTTYETIISLNSGQSSKTKELSDSEKKLTSTSPRTSQRSKEASVILTNSQKTSENFRILTTTATKDTSTLTNVGAQFKESKLPSTFETSELPSTTNTQVLLSALKISQTVTPSKSSSATLSKVSSTSNETCVKVTETFAVTTLPYLAVTSSTTITLTSATIKAKNSEFSEKLSKSLSPITVAGSTTPETINISSEYLDSFLKTTLKRPSSYDSQNLTVADKYSRLPKDYTRTEITRDQTNATKSENTEMTFAEQATREPTRKNSIRVTEEVPSSDGIFLYLKNISTASSSNYSTKVVSKAVTLNEAFESKTAPTVDASATTDDSAIKNHTGSDYVGSKSTASAHSTEKTIKDVLKGLELESDTTSEGSMKSVSFLKRFSTSDQIRTKYETQKTPKINLSTSQNFEARARTNSESLSMSKQADFHNAPSTPRNDNSILKWKSSKVTNHTSSDYVGSKSTASAHSIEKTITDVSKEMELESDPITKESMRSVSFLKRFSTSDQIRTKYETQKTSPEINLSTSQNFEAGARTKSESLAMSKQVDFPSAPSTPRNENPTFKWESSKVTNHTSSDYVGSKSTSVYSTEKTISDVSKGLELRSDTITKENTRSVSSSKRFSTTDQIRTKYETQKTSPKINLSTSQNFEAGARTKSESLAMSKQVDFPSAPSTPRNENPTFKWESSKVTNHTSSDYVGSKSTSVYSTEKTISDVSKGLELRSDTITKENTRSVSSSKRFSTTDQIRTKYEIQKISTEATQVDWSTGLRSHSNAMTQNLISYGLENLSSTLAHQEKTTKKSEVNSTTGSLPTAKSAVPDNKVAVQDVRTESLSSLYSLKEMPLSSSVYAEFTSSNQQFLTEIFLFGSSTKSVVKIDATSKKGRTKDLIQQGRTGITTVNPAAAVSTSTLLRTSSTKGCEIPCPSSDWIEGEEFCYTFLASRKFKSYEDALSKCRKYFSMIGKSDLTSPKNMQLLKNARTEDNDLVFIYAEMTNNYKRYKQVEVINLTSSTSYMIKVQYVVSSDQDAGDVDAVCKLPKYCSEPRCYFKDFETNSDKNDYIVLPTYNSVALNDEVSLSCTADPKNIKQLKYYCNSDGRFEPSPLEKLCKPSNIWIPATTREKKLRVQKISCWKSPRFCATVDCGTHGGCVEKVDHGICHCEMGWFGETCSLDATNLFSLKGTNFTDPDMELQVQKMIRNYGNCQYGLMFLAVATSVILLLHYYFFAEVDGEADVYPHVILQSHRIRTLLLGAVFSLMFRHPGFFSLDVVIGTRVYNFLVNVLFTTVLFVRSSQAFRSVTPAIFYVSSSFNVIDDERKQNAVKDGFVPQGSAMSDAEDGCQVIAFPSRRCRYSAVIDRVSESLSVFCLRPYQIATFNLGAEAKTVLPCYASAVIVVSATTVLNWNHVTTSWALLGVFEEDYIGFPLSMIMLNFVAVLIAISVIESAFNTKAYEPELHLNAIKFYIHKLPYELGKRLVPLERTPPFIVVGASLHFLTWFFIMFSTSDLSSAATSLCGAVVFVLYGICIILQTLLTLSPINKYATIITMMLLPKGLAPKFEINDMKTRKEVLGEWSTSKYSSEKRAETKMFGELPRELTYQVPDDPPFAITPFNQFSPGDPKYMPAFHCQMLWKRLTSSYVSHRLNGFSQEEALKYAKDVDFEYDDYGEEITSQRLYVVDRWISGIRYADRIPDKVNPGKVKNSLPTKNFDSGQETFFQKLVYRDGETIPALIRRSPAVKLKFQENAMLEAFGTEMEDRNEPFKALYFNDPIVEHLEEKYGEDLIDELLARIFSFL